MKKEVENIIISSGERMFNEYLDIKIVGERMFKGFISNYKKDKGFRLDSINGIGVISNIMALSTLIELSDMNSDVIIKQSALFSETLSLIFDNLYQNGKLVFDASPYLFNNTENDVYIDSYVETMSKALVAFIDMRDVVIKTMPLKNNSAPLYNVQLTARFKGEILEDSNGLLKVLEEAIIDCIRQLNKAALPVKPFDYAIGEKEVLRDDIPSVGVCRGWTFMDTNNKNSDLYETSLYFTYHATNAYKSLYDSFKGVLSSEVNQEEFIDDFTELKYSQDKRFFTSYKAVFEEYKLKVISSARYLEKTINDSGIDITTNFIGSGFAQTSYDDVVKHQNGNAVLDTLFSIAIYINGALDEDYAWAGFGKDFYDKIQYSITNIKRVYSVMRREKKEDLISSYKMLFNLKFPVEFDSLIQKFRKACQNIGVMSLIPLLANTYYMVFSYLIKYPSREMIDFLEIVMEQKNGDDNAWYWDKDGFNINNNLYYVFAIENFYDYYNEYENPLSAIGQIHNKNLEKARQLAEKRLDDLNKAKEENRNLQNEYKAKQSEIDKAVTALINDRLNESVNRHIDKYLSDMIEQNISLCIEKERAEQTGMIISNAELYEKYPKARTLRKMAYTEYIKKLVKSLGDSFVEDNTLKKEVGKKILKYFEDQEKIIDSKGENL